MFEEAVFGQENPDHMAKFPLVAPHQFVGVDVAEAHHQVALVGAFGPGFLQKSAVVQSGGVETQYHRIVRLGDVALN